MSNNKESNKANYNQKEVLDTTDEIKSYVKVGTPESKNKKHTEKKHTDKKELENKTVSKKNTKKETAKKNVTNNESVKKDTVATKDTVKHDTASKATDKKEAAKKENVEKATVKKESLNKETSSKDKEISNKENVKKETATKSTENIEAEKKETAEKHNTSKTTVPTDKLTPISQTHVKNFTINSLKIVLPVAACAIFAATIISFVGTRSATSTSSSGIEESESISTLIITDEPLEENAHSDVNELMTTFYKALSDGDMDTVRSLRDYNDETEILQYETKSNFIESYDDVTCYTKPGVSDGSYFVYVSYDVKVEGVDTKAPGLNAFYVYTNDDGNLIIDGNMEDDITAAFKLVTNQDDVVDLYNRIDVDYKDAIASDEQLNAFMTELPSQIKTAVGEALAQREAQNSESSTEASTETSSTEVADTSDVKTNQTVNEIVRTTDTVNVRSSDSETADKLGKAATGTEITRTEVRANGWSKVVYNGQEAYIKSDYLELVSSPEATTDDTATADNTTTTDDTTTATTTTATETVTGKVKALTNVNVRTQPDQNSTKLGTAVAERTFDLLGVEGEWYKIKFNGSTGYAKAEFFQKQ